MRRTTPPTICPSCGSTEIVPIAYGEPPFEMFELEQQGKIKLGGCMVGDPDGDPNLACRACGHQWIGPDSVARRLMRAANV